MATKSVEAVQLPSKETMIQQLREHTYCYGMYNGAFDKIYDDYAGSIANSKKSAMGLVATWDLTIANYAGKFHPMDLVRIHMDFGQVVKAIAPTMVEEIRKIRIDLQ